MTKSQFKTHYFAKYGTFFISFISYLLFAKGR